MFPHEFWLEVSQYRAMWPDVRKGQAVFNVATLIFPNEVGNLPEGFPDPYYNDDNIPAFLKALGIED